jgi:hypothetical protein
MRKVGFVPRRTGGVLLTEWGLLQARNRSFFSHPIHAGRKSLACIIMADAGVVTQTQSGVILVPVPSADFRREE